METLTTIAEVRAWRRGLPGAVGFVPTMGALHEGHLTLARRARHENDHLAASIFVNPLQFAANEDLDRYPRDLEGDSAKLAQAGVDALFFPQVDEIYPAGFVTKVEVHGPLTAVLEGAARPGHFVGVTTVVSKLFFIVQPTRAYFGMKDAQQLLVIAKFVRDLDIDVEVVPVPTVREPDGMAMSSRNQYLAPAEREAARALGRGLRDAEARFAGGERDAAALRGAVAAALEREPLLRAEYISCAELPTLRELERVEETALLSLAVGVGGMRLIDNAWLGVSGNAVPVP